MNNLLIKIHAVSMVLVCFVISSNAQVKSTVKFDKVKYNFGFVSESKTKNISVNFELTNTGDSPFVILKAVPSCGCIRVESIKTPIISGAKGVIKVIIDTKGQLGKFNKSIIVKLSSNDDVPLLKITGVIL